MCYKKWLPNVLVGLLAVSVVSLLVWGITAMDYFLSPNPDLKYGMKVRVIGDSDFLKFYDECTGILEKYIGVGKYEINTTCITYGQEDGRETIRTVKGNPVIHKKHLELIE